MGKSNCWEVMGCHHANHGPDGCPAFTGKGDAHKLHGIHAGTQAGRACWVIAGTRCGKAGEPQGEFAAKERNCMKCRFYIQVQSEEGMQLRLAVTLQEMLKQ